MCAGLRQVWRAALLAALLLGCGPEVEDAGPIRIALLNLHLARNAPGKAAAEIESGSAQIRALVKVIVAKDPDILVLLELDYDREGRALAAFRKRLAAAGSTYAFTFHAPVNAGRRTGLDLDGDGKTNGPGDAQGWGVFEGQFGMAVLSRLPIQRENIRTFRKQLWADMPGALFPAEILPAEARNVLRLSSKAHWDVPVRLSPDRNLHLLVSHPTPPVFDGPADFNGKRNHDEIRFWGEYIMNAQWIKDDTGQYGGLSQNAHFAIIGGLNNDPNDGDGRHEAIRDLLTNPLISDPRPRSKHKKTVQTGANLKHLGDPALDTAHWPAEEIEASGNLRVDYILLAHGLKAAESGVFWPEASDPQHATAEAASDHRLIWVDIFR